MQIDLNKFCDKSGKGWMSKPFTQGEYTFATNGFVLIRVPKILGIPEIGKEHKINQVFLEVFDKSPEMFYPIGDLGQKNDCNKCDGKGFHYTCPECDGTGYASAYNDFSEYDDLVCQTCGGDGNISETEFRKINLARNHFQTKRCRQCYGTGKRYENDSYYIGGIKLSTAQLGLIEDLPDVKIGIFANSNSELIKFSGGDGLISRIREF